MHTILIVDDEERIRNIYKRLFQAACSSAVRVLESTDAVTATQCLIREDVDLVLLDIRMPNIDGRFMHEVIRECNPDIKVIVSSVMPVETQKKMIPGASDYFDKSLGTIALLEKVAESFV